MEKKICIVTGANSGIGKQAAIQLARQGCHVILACRNRERGERARQEILALDASFSVELRLVDMSLLSSIRNFGSELQSEHRKIDVLIHNAALFSITKRKRELTSEGHETIWATNHLGPVLLTELLMKQLQASTNGRIITIASKGLLAKPFLKINFQDPECAKGTYDVVTAYYQSKLAQIMYTYWLASRCQNTSVTANCIRVPAVQIDISRHPELSACMKWAYSIKAKQSITPQKMASSYVSLALDPAFSKTNGLYLNEKLSETASGRYSHSDATIHALMALTKESLPEIAPFV